MKKKRTFKRKRTFRKVILRRKSSLRKLIMTHRKRFSKRHNFTRKIGGAPKPKKVQIQKEQEQAPYIPKVGEEPDLVFSTAKQAKLYDTGPKDLKEDVDAPLKSDPDKSIPGRQIYRNLSSRASSATSKETSRIAPSSTVKD